MSDNARWVRPLGSASADGWDVAIDTVDDWSHTSLYAVTLADGESRTVAAGEFERVVVPLTGSVSVTVVDPEGLSHDCVLAGRDSVFAGPSDVAYATRDCEVTVTARGGTATVAVCGARAARRHTPPLRHVGVADVPVELRGRGHRLPRGAQLRHARRARRRLDHRLRGDHPRRQLELLPAAQARRAPARRRERARGDLLLRGPINRAKRA